MTDKGTKPVDAAGNRAFLSPRNPMADSETRGDGGYDGTAAGRRRRQPLRAGRAGGADRLLRAVDHRAAGRSRPQGPAGCSHPLLHPSGRGGGAHTGDRRHQEGQSAQAGGAGADPRRPEYRRKHRRDGRGNARLRAECRRYPSAGAGGQSAALRPDGRPVRQGGRGGGAEPAIPRGARCPAAGRSRWAPGRALFHLEGAVDDGVARHLHLGDARTWSAGGRPITIRTSAIRRWS